MRTHTKRQRPKTSSRPLRARSISIALLAAVLLAAGVTASAGATSSIEGVWSFNGGQIAIQPEGNGKFEGVVVAATTFKTCEHKVTEKIWKEITPQPDGSFWGFHQWFYENSSCTPNLAELGRTAWRVIGEAGGPRYLRVCLSEPGKPQPTIAPNSSGIASYSCVSSALLSPLPSEKSGTAANKETLSLPSTRKCLSVRLFQIHLQDPKFDPFTHVSITLKGKKVATRRSGKFIVATINLKRLPRGAFTIKIHTTTVLGHHLSASRTYHTCIKKIVKKKTHKKG